MAFGKKFDKNKLKLKEKRKQQNPLFKRKKFCRFTAAGVEQVDYKDVDT
jgi:small subunit ribosomal protein S18